MQKFKVFAEFTNLADRKYHPEWEVEVSASLMGEALERGEVLFLAHCVEQKLDRSLFELHVGTP